jgi:outer membrane protein assembly factor BamB
MKKIKFVSITILTLIFPSILSSIVEADYNNQNSQTDINYYDKGFRYNIQGWTYIHIEGEPYERGYQYGYLGCAEIVDTIQRWGNLGHDIKFMKLFLIKSQQKNYEKLSEQWWNICRTIAKNVFLKQVPNQYVEEMKGIADGIKARGEKVFGREIEFEDVLASQFVQESWYSGIKYFYKRFHPFRGFFSSITDILTGKFNEEHPGHCSAFIATGDATSNGEIVIAHSTIFNRLIAQRCNFIVDIQPSDGYRFIMTCPPGSISSQEDYYQNQAGIVLTETELVPQGPFKLRATPKGIRSRRAIQYSDSIDDVIFYLNKGNNGLIPNEWLIGDVKTGEIASFEQALYNAPVKRTFNGFFYSCNVPHNKKVERELFGVIGSLKSTISSIFKKHASGKIEKFEEIKEKFYGEINTEIAKKILSTEPICIGTTDGKISDTTHVKNMGFLAFMGAPNGELFVPTKAQKNKLRGITELPSSGWVEIYSSVSKPTKLQNNPDYNEIKKTPIIIWQQNIDESNIIDLSPNVISKNIIYTSIANGKIFALDAEKGITIWNKKIRDRAFNHEISNDLIVICTDRGVCAINKDTQAIKWYQYVGETSSKPIINKNRVIASSSDGNLYAFDINSGNAQWNFKLPCSGVISDIKNDIACIGSCNICYGINIKDGETQWEFNTEGKITAPPRIDEKSVYFGSWDGNVYALDVFTGEEKWVFNTGWGIDTTPTISDNLVFVGSNDNNFYALNKDNGELIWFYKCKSAIHSSPTVYGEFVFFGSDDGRLYALNKTNGGLEWDFAPDYSLNYDANNYLTTPILSDPLVENSIVYISSKGNIYAIDAQTIEKPERVQREPDDRYHMLIIFTLLALLGVTLILRFFLNCKHQKNKK